MLRIPLLDAVDSLCPAPLAAVVRGRALPVMGKSGREPVTVDCFDPMELASAAVALARRAVSA